VTLEKFEPKSPYRPGIAGSRWKSLRCSTPLLFTTSCNKKHTVACNEWLFCPVTIVGCGESHTLKRTTQAKDTLLANTVHVACTALGVSACATILRSDSDSCYPLHQEHGKSRRGLSLSNLLAGCQSERCSLDSAGLFSRLVSACLMLELHYVGPPLSILCVYHPLHVSYLFGEACTHCMHVACHLFTDLPSSHRSFPDWTTPVKRCSIVICMFID